MVCSPKESNASSALATCAGSWLARLSIANLIDAPSPSSATARKASRAWRRARSIKESRSRRSRSSPSGSIASDASKSATARAASSRAYPRTTSGGALAGSCASARSAPSADAGSKRAARAGSTDGAPIRPSERASLVPHVADVVFESTHEQWDGSRRIGRGEGSRRGNPDAWVDVAADRGRPCRTSPRSAIPRALPAPAREPVGIARSSIARSTATPSSGAGPRRMTDAAVARTAGSGSASRLRIESVVSGEPSGRVSTARTAARRTGGSGSTSAFERRERPQRLRLGRAIGGRLRAPSRRGHGRRSARHRPPLDPGDRPGSRPRLA